MQASNVRTIGGRGLNLYDNLLRVNQKLVVVGEDIPNRLQVETRRSHRSKCVLIQKEQMEVGYSPKWIGTLGYVFRAPSI
ncbi:hypothetical protein OPQ81_006566 [Rhizoctonia solani]|nr:hypothetical protein OPQ81_006566 [Rhizoctonia solani]